LATIVVLAFKEAERGPLVDPLKAAGHRVVVLEPKDPDFRLALRGLEAVDAVVVDLSVKGASGREAAQWIGEQKRYRKVPVLLTGVPDGEEDVTRMKVPFGRRVSAAHIDKAIAHALTPGGKKGAGEPPA
jgi:DNA-binding response OmpR family regulator